MMNSIFKLSILICLVAFSTALPAQNRKYSVSGTVSDSATGQPLVNVNISIVGDTFGGTTNEAGEFSLKLAQIPSILYFSYVGYSIGSYQVNKSGEKDIKIMLEPEVQEIGEVTIRAEKISKVIRGDTLNILDYEIDGNRLILFASPYKQQSDLRIFLTTLEGKTLDYMQVRNAGKQIKYPDLAFIQTEFLLKDFTGQVNYLDKVCAHEVRYAFDKLFFGYDTQYPDFMGRVFPIKCEMEGKLVFQSSTRTENYTWYFGRGSKTGEIIKIVKDKNAGPYSKFVMVPLFRKENELFVFDFYAGHIEVFDHDLNTVRIIPLDFQFRQVTEAIFWEYQDVDSHDFTRNILFDERAGKAYAFYRMRSDGRQSLREVNLETGKIERMVEIPDYPNISNIRVSGNILYFLYDTKVYPYYRLLYRMTI